MEEPPPPSRPSALRAALALATLLAALALFSPAADAGAQGRAQVYRCQHRVADDLLPLAQAALAGEGEAVADRATNAIVLIGPPGAVAGAMALLAQQDRRTRTILLHYESRSRRALEAAGVRIDWRVGSGSFSIGTATFPPGESGVEATIGARESRGEGRFAGTLRIVEGQSGRITTGRSVPVTTRQGWAMHTDLVSAESGFDARGRVLGDGRVQVDLAPLQSNFRRDGSIAFTGGDTSLVLSPGETVVLGSVEESRSEAEAGAHGARARSASEGTVLLLRAEVE